MISIMVRCLLSIISTSLNVFVRLIQRIQSSLLQTGINLILPPFTVTVCANIVARYHTPSPEVTFIPTPDSTLINGLGRYSGGPNSTLAVINVMQGKRYRFRLVSISCDPNYVFSIVNHNMVSCLILV